MTGWSVAMFGWWSILVIPFGLVLFYVAYDTVTFRTWHGVWPWSETW